MFVSKDRKMAINPDYLEAVYIDDHVYHAMLSSGEVLVLQGNYFNELVDFLDQ